MANTNRPEMSLKNAVKRKTNWSQHTKVTMVEVNFTWTIENFGFKTRAMKTGEFLTSGIFSADGDEKVQWQLMCYPKGDVAKEDNQNRFSYFLKFNSGNTLMIEFTLSILDKNGIILKKYLNHHTFKQSPDAIGYDNFVSQQELLEKYVKNDTLTLHCHLTYEVPNVDSLEPSRLKTKRLEVPEDCIAQHLGHLFNTGRMSDVTFTIGRQKFKVHKNILSARCQVFAEMFQINGKVSPAESLKIEDCEPEAFEAMLRFLYTDEMEETEEMTKKLLPIAKKYQVKLLKKKCEEVLSKNISTENCSEMLMLADMQEALFLKKDASNYFRRHSREIFKTTGWKTLRQTLPQLGIEVFEFTAS